ncbi:hypothetical protein BDW68DRAFT_187612 [Aspergillus falconensis]
MEPVCALTWNSCPADILYLIFKLLSPLEHQALCLHAYYSDLEPPQPITQLLRTLISKPQLAAHIRRLHLDGKAWAVHATRFKLPKIHIPEDQLAEPVAFIRRTGVPYRDWWSRDTPLKFLHLGRAFTRQSALTGMMLRSAICESGTYKLGNFQHLQELSFLRRESRDEARNRKVKNTADLLPFFYLPNLQHLKTLNLTNIREGCLGEILAVTKNLETLHWKWYYDSGVEDDFITQTPAAAVGDQFFPGLEATGSLRALVNFGRIKTLQIPLAFLVGFAQDRTKRLQDVIPRNVEFLTITDDLALQNSDYLEEEWPLWEWKDYAILGQLESWLREWTRWTLRLSRITLLLSWIDTDTNQWPPRAREQLHGLSVQAGIRLDFVNTKHQL